MTETNPPGQGRIFMTFLMAAVYRILYQEHTNKQQTSKVLSNQKLPNNKGNNREEKQTIEWEKILIVKIYTTNNSIARNKNKTMTKFQSN